MSFVLTLFLMASPDTPIESGHVFAHGDRILIGIAQMSEEFVLNPAGEVLVRGLGTLRLEGMTSASAEAELAGLVETRIGRRLPVSVILLEPATPRVFVAGAVARPGWREARSLVEALADAQPAPDASLEAVVVEEASGETFTIDYAAILAGDAPDIAVEGGDRIVVTRPLVYPVRVAGWVEHPGVYQTPTILSATEAAGPKEGSLDRVFIFTNTETPALVPRDSLARPAEGPIRIEVPRLPRVRVEGEVRTPGEVFARSIAEALALAGGVTTEADLSSLRLLDSLGRSVPVDSGGVVTQDAVLVVRPRAGSRRSEISVYGAVARPGPAEARTLTEAVTAASPAPSADFSQVRVERAGRTATVDAAAMVAGTARDLPLVEGDRLVIPIRPPEATEETAAGVVNVLGEVSKPGAVEPGRLTDILVASGGITENSRTRDITIRTASGESSRVSLDDVLAGRSDDPYVPDGATVFVASSAPARRFWSDLRAILGTLTAALLLGARL